jgi:hypothetical protein
MAKAAVGLEQIPDREMQIAEMCDLDPPFLFLIHGLLLLPLRGGMKGAQ